MSLHRFIYSRIFHKRGDTKILRYIFSDCTTFQILELFTYPIALYFRRPDVTCPEVHTRTGAIIVRARVCMCAVCVCGRSALTAARIS